MIVGSQFFLLPIAWGFVGVVTPISGRRQIPLRLQGWWGNQNNDATSLKPSTTNSVEDEIVALEKEVVYTTQAELDLQNVNRAVTSALSKNPTAQESSAIAPQWSIALAGGLSMGSIVFVLTQSIALGLVASLGVFFVASRNPVEEDDPAGAVARTVRP